MSAQKTPGKRVNTEKLHINAQENVGMNLDEDLNVDIYSQDENDDEATSIYVDFLRIRCRKRDRRKSHIPQEGRHTGGYKDYDTTKTVCGQPTFMSKMEHSFSLWKETSDETFSYEETILQGSFGQITSRHSANTLNLNPYPKIGISSNVQVAVSIKEEPEYDVKQLQTEQYNPGFIDTHCHLDFLFQRISHRGSYRKFQSDSFDTDPFPVSYEGCVAIFCKPWTFRKISWWEEIISEANVWAAFGCHPHFSDSFGEEEEGYLRHALQNSKTVALGEIGLDYSGKNSENHEVQQSVFRRQLKIALEFNKPLVIHCREAHRDCIETLKEIVPRDYLIHRHCFTETWVEAKEWLETFSRSYLGFTNLVTYPKCRRSWNAQEVVRRIPLDRLLLETDAPYFRPHCYSDSGQFSHPGMAIHVAAQVAVLRNEELQAILKQARQNTKNMYDI